MQYSQKQIDQNSKFSFHRFRNHTAHGDQNPWRFLHLLMATEMTGLILAASFVAGDKLQQATLCIPQAAMIEH